MDVKDLIIEADYDFKNIVIGKDSPDCFYDVKDYELSPEEYLEFAKNDSKNSEVRGRLNAITNAKRAIDCQTDMLINGLKLNLKSEVLKEFINNSPDSIDGIPLKYKVVKALNIAPIILITEIRKLRNKVEHEYKLPSDQDLISAIELAELYINTVNYKYENMYMFEITDKKKREKAAAERKLSGIYFNLNENILSL